MISWLTVGEWKAGRATWRLLAALSAACHARFGLIKTYLRRSLDFCWISPALIALEPRSEKALGGAVKALRSKHAVIPRGAGPSHVNGKTKPHLDERDAYRLRLLHAVSPILWLHLNMTINKAIVTQKNSLAYVVYLCSWSRFPPNI